MPDNISKYFPNLSQTQIEQFDKMISLYPVLNEKINVISRKDINNIEINHILHSLAIAKYLSFASGTKVLDLGTGGGFPGIPLAVMFPECEFFLLDRIGKKIKVASEVAEEIGLKNVKFQHGDSGEFKEMVDFAVSRAVMPQKDLISAVKKNISKSSFNVLPNGLISLKGGNLEEELKGLTKRSEIVDIKQYFEVPFFETKKIVYTQI